jgi:hypothetical protein
MDVLTTILACSLYLEDDALVRAIAESNSQSQPYFVIDASVDRTEVDPPPLAKTVDEAVAHAAQIVAHGGKPLLGLMQLPPVWLDAYGRELRDGFDACTNIAIGTAMLSQFAYECARDAPHTTSPRGAHARRPGTASSAAQALRTCVLRRYQDAIALPDFVTVTTLELRYQRPRTADVTDAPIFWVELPSSSRRFGPEELLVSARALVPLSTTAAQSSAPAP